MTLNICLWKLRGDDKIADALASLLNTTKDLSVLAATHSIEGQLYEGGGLEKVMSLLGNERHRKFRSKNIESVSSKKSEWLKLAEFLQYELTLRNRIILDKISAQLMGIDLKVEVRKKDFEDGKKSGTQVGSFPTSPSVHPDPCTTYIYIYISCQIEHTDGN